MDLVWIWYGSGVDLVWIWYGSALDSWCLLVWICPGFLVSKFQGIGHGSGMDFAKICIWIRTWPGSGPDLTWPVFQVTRSRGRYFLSVINSSSIEGIPDSGPDPRPLTQQLVLPYLCA